MSAPSKRKEKVDSSYICVAVVLFALSALTLNGVREAQHSGRKVFAGVRGYVTIRQARIFVGACLAGGLYAWPLDFGAGQKPTQRQMTSNQAMQRTANKTATVVQRVRHPRFGCVARFTGLAIADLVSR
jgi:hypothetical protein